MNTELMRRKFFCNWEYYYIFSLYVQYMDNYPTGNCRLKNMSKMIMIKTMKMSEKECNQKQVFCSEVFYFKKVWNIKQTMSR